MKANDILRRIRYILDFDENRMVTVFAAAEQTVTASQVSTWLKKEDAPGFEVCSNALFACFLDGLVNLKRGKKEGERRAPEENLNNNGVLKKLKIAFDLQAEDVLAILALADVTISKHELSAFFRRPNHKHYRDCKDQILRNFLMGMQIRYRDGASG